MKHIILIVFILYLPNFASAQMTIDLEPNWPDRLFQEIDQKIIGPVKQTVQNLPENVEKGVKQLLEKLQKEKKEKQEEIKQEIKSEVKEEAKEWGQRAAERVKRFLAPLKNKIQQGTGLIREGVNKIKDFIIYLLKE